MSQTPRTFGRHSIRLRGWDYAGLGWYFVTFNTSRRRRLLARVVGGRMRLTRSGRIVQSVWNAIPEHFPRATIDAFVVMPDHVHGIIRIVERLEDRTPWGFPGTEAGSLGAMMRSLKGNSTRLMRARWPGVGRVWHRNYYERILRDPDALDAVRRYIAANPRKWIRRYGRR